MCGIVGLLLKKPALRPALGELMLPMLIGMTERGPDSAGLAVYREPVAEGRCKYSLYVSNGRADWPAIGREAGKRFGSDATLDANANHAILTARADRDAIAAWLADAHRDIAVLSAGQAMDIYKDIGTPAAIAERYGFSRLSGTHVVGHTRMATESAVTPAHAHPFTFGEDFCLVHNGSLSNPNDVRRQLEHEGVRFVTDNDTEAACRYIGKRLAEGDDLAAAMTKGFDVLDGFYTLLIGTRDTLAIVRDPFACKPAIVAETDDYVAISSEYRGLAALPGVASAKLFEPRPRQLYRWQVQ
jgi:amidophosphoribosyltransferase